MKINHLHLSGGVGRKIFAAFFAVSLFSFASALVGWVGLGFVREAQETVLSEVYPSVRDAQIIARESTALVSQMSFLHGARSARQLEALVDGLASREERISVLLARFESNNVFGGLREQIEPIISEMSGNVETLAKLSSRMIEANASLNGHLADLLDQAGKMVVEARNLGSIVAENSVENSGTIYRLMQSDDPNQRAALVGKFEGFIQRNLGDFQKITDLQSRSEIVAEQLERLRDVISVDQVPILRDQMALNLRAMTNTVSRLGVAGDRRMLIEPLTKLSEHVFQAVNIFVQQEEVLITRARMEQVRASADKSERTINDLVKEIVARTETAMEAQSTNARTVASRTQIIMIVLAGMAFASSIFIFGVYINNNLLFRLDRLAASVYRLTNGDFATEVSASGDDQITRLEEAVEAFRSNSILLREAENKLLLRSEELERSNLDLQQFAYVTSHDLRAPLRAIGSLSEWVEEDLAAGKREEVAANFVRLRGRVQRMDSLLNGILQYSRAGSGDGDNVAVPVIDTARQIFDDLNTDEQFSLEIRSNVETLVSRLTFFQQVLGNLISNAIKHHDKAQGTIDIEFASDARFNTLTISDDGPGIPEKFSERIFKMFQTLKPRDEVEASGIGLALVKRLVERRSGTLSVEKSEAGGARFIIQWPVERE